MSCKVAREYDAMMKEYMELKEEVAEKILDPELHMYTQSLVDAMEELRGRMLQFNTRYISSPHYIIPDNETTKH